MSYKRKQYPKYYNRANYTKGWTCNGKRVYDCIGLLKGAIWSNGNFNVDPVYNSSQDVGANYMLTLCKTKGKIATLPEVPGILLFKPGHIGVYIGNGMTIHAAGHNRGIVKESIKNIPWTDWGYCPWINYTQKTGSVTSTTTANKTTPAKTNTVKTVKYKITKDVNVRKGPSVVYAKVKYDGYPAKIKAQLKKKYNYLPAGTQVEVIGRTSSNWLKIGDNLYIAGNYATKI